MYISEKPIEKFIHSTTLSKTKEFAALNGKFPSLAAYGIVMCLYEMWFYSPRNKIKFEESDMEAFCHEYHVDLAFFKEVFKYCVNTIKIFTYSTECYLIIEDLRMQKVKHMADRESRRQVFLQRREFYAKHPKNRIVRVELPRTKKLRIRKHLSSFLYLTTELITKYEHAYRYLGDISILFDDFKRQVLASYDQYYTVITEENYPMHFEAYLNTVQEVREIQSKPKSKRK